MLIIGVEVQEAGRKVQGAGGWGLGAVSGWRGFAIRATVLLQSVTTPQPSCCAFPIFAIRASGNSQIC